MQISGIVNHLVTNSYVSRNIRKDNRLTLKGFYMVLSFGVLIMKGLFLLFALNLKFRANKK